LGVGSGAFFFLSREVWRYSLLVGLLVPIPGLRSFIIGDDVM
jgi:hypothetical protein